MAMLANTRPQCQRDSEELGSSGSSDKFRCRRGGNNKREPYRRVREDGGLRALYWVMFKFSRLMKSRAHMNFAQKKLLS